MFDLTEKIFITNYMYKLFSNIDSLQTSERFFKSYEIKKNKLKPIYDYRKKWVPSWNKYPSYFSIIPPLISDKTATFLKRKRRKSLKEIKEFKLLKLNRVLTNIFVSFEEDSLKTKWKYIIHNYQKKNILSWDNIFENLSKSYGNKKMTDKLWFNSKFSKDLL